MIEALRSAGPTMFDLVLLVGVAVFLCRQSKPLLMLSLLLAVAVAVLPFTNAMPIGDRALVYIPLDLIGGVLGVVIWRAYQSKAGLGFSVLALASMVVHLGFAINGAEPVVYIAMLNGLFIISCLMLWGAGIVDYSRHGRRRRHPTRNRVGSGVE